MINDWPCIAKFENVVSKAHQIWSLGPLGYPICHKLGQEKSSRWNDARSLSPSKKKEDQIWKEPCGIFRRHLRGRLQSQMAKVKDIWQIMMFIQIILNRNTTLVSRFEGQVDIREENSSPSSIIQNIILRSRTIVSGNSWTSCKTSPVKGSKWEQRKAKGNKTSEESSASGWNRSRGHLSPK